MPERIFSEKLILKKSADDKNHAIGKFLRGQRVQSDFVSVEGVTADYMLTLKAPRN